ncbi:hypothetical protein BX592_114114 [Paraburkholderia rhizosphaerae]|uniref:Uncharacterized protein n=1 Tax=Paraburkholderia rhizosphaerae TaxID=480658 RepID=A0A4R8LLH1_9BURK|nr:hypothetical protein BX592_114114 [Paraburkholderia rhizosphaerae]
MTVGFVYDVFRMTAATDMMQAAKESLMKKCGTEVGLFSTNL